jgi:hypothetical protein
MLKFSMSDAHPALSISVCTSDAIPAVFPSIVDSSQSSLLTMSVAYSCRPASMIRYSMYEFYCTMDIKKREQSKATFSEAAYFV